MAIMDVCRICLAEAVEKDMTQLSEEVKENNKNCWDIMLFCLNIQVSPESNLTTKLCIKCYTKIVSFHKFKMMAIKNDAYLRCIDKEEEIKCEQVFEMDTIKCEEMSNGPDEALYEVETIDKIELQIKNETNLEESDDELLSAIKKIKYEYINEASKENEDTPSKGKRKKTKIKKRTRVMERREKICEECGKRVINLNEHMSLHKPAGARKRFKCTACDKTFASYSARYRHHKIKHLGIKDHCDECGKDVVSLKNHCRVMHNNDVLPFECVSCGRRFISQSKLDLHMLSHTKNRSFACEQCGKTFRNKFSLMQHKRQVHDQEKSHLCQICSKRFFKKYHLQVHIRSHTKEKPCKCPECGKGFFSSSVLKNHRMIHSEVKKFACNYCDMAFKTPGYLRNHMVSHTKEKRYSCKYCDMPFGRSDHRLRHERTAHERHLLPAA